MNYTELAVEQIKTLPDNLAKEVLDFVGYLKERHERAEWEDLMQAQSAAMNTVWDNPEDEAWNDL